MVVTCTCRYCASVVGCLDIVATVARPAAWPAGLGAVAKRRFRSVAWAARNLDMALDGLDWVGLGYIGGNLGKRGALASPMRIMPD